MHLKRLILIVFALLVLAPSMVFPEPAGKVSEFGVSSDIERPQWSDIGMHDVLAVTSSASLTPPNTIRLLHETASGAFPVPVPRRMLSGFSIPLPQSSCFRFRSGYIYLIRCLRL